MNIDKYKENMEMVSEWLTDNEEIGPEMAFVLNAQMATKVETEKDATRAWSAIKSILGLCENPPITRRGANCPYRAYVDNMEGLEDALLALYTVAGHMTFKHGKSGGGTYPHFEEYLTHMKETFIRGIKREAKEGNFTL